MCSLCITKTPPIMYPIGVALPISSKIPEWVKYFILPAVVFILMDLPILELKITDFVWANCPM